MTSRHDGDFHSTLLTVNFKRFIMSTFTKICGIDVSKDDLDYHLFNQLDCEPKQRTTISKVNNELGDIAAHFSSPIFDNTLFVVEYTGNYSSKLLYQLSQLNHAVSVVNPYQSKSFMAALGMTNKDDKQAAKALMLMGQQRQKKPKLYKVPSEEMQKRKQIQSALRGLQKQERMLLNQIHALEQLPIISDVAKTSFENMLETVQQEIHNLQEQLYIPHQDPEFNEKMKYGTSVKGIGVKTGQAILMATSGLDDFDSSAKLAKFLGLTPGSHYSGSSVYKRSGITKHGSSAVRASLYMGANSAIQHNKSCKELYERLRKVGKTHKVAKIAVMHKMVKQFFVCVKSKTMFDNEFHLKNEKISNNE